MAGKNRLFVFWMKLKNNDRGIVNTMRNKRFIDAETAGYDKGDGYILIEGVGQWKIKKINLS